MKFSISCIYRDHKRQIRQGKYRYEENNRCHVKCLGRCGFKLCVPYQEGNFQSDKYRSTVLTSPITKELIS